MALGKATGHNFNEADVVGFAETVTGESANANTAIGLITKIGSESAGRDTTALRFSPQLFTDSRESFGGTVMDGNPFIKTSGPSWVTPPGSVRTSRSAPRTSPFLGPHARLAPVVRRRTSAP